MRPLTRVCDRSLRAERSLHSAEVRHSSSRPDRARDSAALQRWPHPRPSLQTQQAIGASHPTEVCSARLHSDLRHPSCHDARKAGPLHRPTQTCHARCASPSRFVTSASCRTFLPPPLAPSRLLSPQQPPQSHSAFRAPHPCAAFQPRQTAVSSALRARQAPVEAHLKCRPPNHAPH